MSDPSLNSTPRDIERSERTVTEAVAAPVASRRGPQSPWVEALLELGALDRAVYEAVATTPTAHLDRPLRRLSRSADAGALWLVIAAGLAATRGAPGRRVAGEAVTSLAVTAITVNLGAKSIFRRRRPDRAGHDRTPRGACRPPPRARFHPGTRQHRSPSPTPSVATSRSSASRSGSSPLRSPTPTCTSACTTPATSSSARSWAPEPPLLSAQHGIIGAHSHPAQRPPLTGTDGSACAGATHRPTAPHHGGRRPPRRTDRHRGSMRPCIGARCRG